MLPERALQRYALLCAGGVVLGVGVALILAARLGADCVAVLFSGVANALDVSFGEANVLVSFLLLIGWWRVGGVRPGPASFLQPVLVGASVNLLLPHLATPDPLWARFGVLVAGIVCVGAGAGLYLASDLGPAALDGAAIAVSRWRPHWRFTLLYAALQLTALAIGVTLGGPAGAGTLLAGIGVGYVLAPVRRRFEYTPDSTAAPDPVR